MRLKYSQIPSLVAFGVCLYTALNHLHSVANLLRGMFSLAFPVFAGGMLAFILSVPHRFIERSLCKVLERLRIHASHKIISAASLLLTLTAILLVVVLLCTLVIPALAVSIQSAREMLLLRLPEWTAFFNSLEIDSEWLTQLGEAMYNALSLDFSASMSKFLQSVADIAVSTMRGVLTGGLSLVIAVYILLSRQDLSRQFQKLLYAFLPRTAAAHVCDLARFIDQTYSKFLASQCTEAVILGTLMFAVLGIAGIPYASIIAVMTGVFSFVPYVGAFLSCFLGTALVLFVSPFQALLCLVLYQAVQFLENQLIYPHVVGGSVGLPPLWTIISVLIGGRLMGIVGMVFFIPAVSVIYSLLREYVNRRLCKKAGDGPSGK